MARSRSDGSLHTRAARACPSAHTHAAMARSRTWVTHTRTLHTRAAMARLSTWSCALCSERHTQLASLLCHAANERPKQSMSAHNTSSRLLSALRSRMQWTPYCRRAGACVCATCCNKICGLIIKISCCFEQRFGPREDAPAQHAYTTTCTYLCACTLVCMCTDIHSNIDIWV